MFGVTPTRSCRGGHHWPVGRRLLLSVVGRLVVLRVTLVLGAMTVAVSMVPVLMMAMFLRVFVILMVLVVFVVFMIRVVFLVMLFMLWLMLLIMLILLLPSPGMVLGSWVFVFSLCN